MTVRQASLAGLGFSHRNGVGFGEAGEHRFGVAVKHAAAGHDQRFFGGAQGFGRGG